MVISCYELFVFPLFFELFSEFLVGIASLPSNFTETLIGFFYVVGISRVLLLPLLLLLFLAHLLVCSAGASLFLFDLSVDVFMICVAGGFHWIILFFFTEDYALLKLELLLCVMRVFFNG